MWVGFEKYGLNAITADRPERAANIREVSGSNEPEPSGSRAPEARGQATTTAGRRTATGVAPCCLCRFCQRAKRAQQKRAS